MNTLCPWAISSLRPQGTNQRQDSTNRGGIICGRSKFQASWDCLLLTWVHHRILRRGQLSPPAPDAPRQSRQPMQHQEELYQKLEVCIGIARFRLQNSKQTRFSPPHAGGRRSWPISASSRSFWKKLNFRTASCLHVHRANISLRCCDETGQHACHRLHICIVGVLALDGLMKVCVTRSCAVLHQKYQALKACWLSDLMLDAVAARFLDDATSFWCKCTRLHDSFQPPHAPASQRPTLLP